MKHDWQCQQGKNDGPTPLKPFLGAILQAALVCFVSVLIVSFFITH